MHSEYLGEFHPTFKKVDHNKRSFYNFRKPNYVRFIENEKLRLKKFVTEKFLNKKFKNTHQPFSV